MDLAERGESPQAELGTPGLLKGSGLAACSCLLRNATMPLRSSLLCCLTRLARFPFWRRPSRWSRIYLAHASRNIAPAQSPSGIHAHVRCGAASQSLPNAYPGAAAQSRPRFAWHMLSAKRPLHSLQANKSCKCLTVLIVIKRVCMASGRCGAA